MNAFFLLYALTITLELVLSVVMALFIFLIVAPRGAASASTVSPTPARRQLAGRPRRALTDVFATISSGHDDLATILHARRMLERTLPGAATPQAAPADRAND